MNNLSRAEARMDRAIVDGLGAEAARRVYDTLLSVIGTYSQLESACNKLVAPIHKAIVNRDSEDFKFQCAYLAVAMKLADDVHNGLLPFIAPEIIASNNRYDLTGLTNIVLGKE